MARPKALTPAQAQQTRELLLKWPNTIAGIARGVGVSRSTIYRAIEENGWDRMVPEMARGGYWYWRPESQHRVRE
jgi:hypothetical protein